MVFVLRTQVHLQSKSFGSEVFPTNNPSDGMTLVRSTVLEKNLKSWVLASSNQHDDQVYQSRVQLCNRQFMTVLPAKLTPMA